MSQIEIFDAISAEATTMHSMHSDNQYFLKIDNFDGGSNEPHHAGWIPIAWFDVKTTKLFGRTLGGHIDRSHSQEIVSARFGSVLIAAGCAQRIDEARLYGIDVSGKFDAVSSSGLIRTLGTFTKGIVVASSSSLHPPEMYWTIELQEYDKNSAWLHAGHQKSRPSGGRTGNVGPTLAAGLRTIGR